MDVSIIVRFRNEARFLESTLWAVREQRFPGAFEIIAVDNLSGDGSREIAERYADRVLQIETYLPGRALNLAIEHARGRCIAVLSAHTLPADRDWLCRLLTHMDRPRLAGVYGGQLFNLSSKYLDKRDLDIFSTLTPRTETRDSDFWNANSMFPHRVWERQRFDETVYELEDHHWTKRLLPQGFEVRFEPRALVYHYSHLDRLDREFLPPSSASDRERIEEAVRALESPDAGWPEVMSAGLTLSSLTASPWIHLAVPAIGRHLAEHWDFDVRWRMAQALGKIPRPESAGFLVRALEDPSFYPRDEAAWSLARLGALAVPGVRQAAGRLRKPSLPFAALALGASGVPEAEREGVGILLSGLLSEDRQMRRDSAYFAGEVAMAAGAESLVPALGALLDEGDAELCKVGCWALGCFAGSAAPLDWPRVRGLAFGHPDVLVRFEATAALGKLAQAEPRGETVRPLLEICRDPEGRVRYAAVQSLRLLAESGVGVPSPDLEEDEDFGVVHELALLDAAREMPLAAAAG